MLKLLLLALVAGLALGGQDEPPKLTPVSIATHPESVTRLALGLKGKLLYTAGADRALRAWNLKKDEFVWQTKFAATTAPTLAMGIAEKTMATIVGAPAYALWNLKDGSAESGATGAPVQGTAMCMAFDPKGRWIWLGLSKGGTVRLTAGNVNGWSKRGFDNQGTSSLALDAKVKQMAVGGVDGSVRFINPSSTKKDEKTVFEVHDEPVTALAFGPKGKQLAVGAKHGGLELIALKKGKQLLKFEGHKAAICALAIDPRGRWLASGDIEGQLLLWDLEDGSRAALLDAPAEGAVAGIGFLNKGKQLVATTGGKSILVWDLSEL